MQVSNEELLSILRARLTNGSGTNSERQLMRELEEVSNKLKKSEEMKSHFLSNIRNEINNPLASVLGLTDFLMTAESLDSAQIKRKASLIYNEIFQLDFQMQNIFAAADIEAGETVIEPVKVHIERLLDDVVNAFKFKMEQKQLRLKKVVLTPSTELNTDVYKLYLVLRNLVANAIEYSETGGEIRVLAGWKGEQLSICITDSGQGMSELEQRQLFQRFHQLESGHTKRHGGHGLGLSVTKELVELLHGSIHVESAKGKGSTFTILLSPLKENLPGVIGTDVHNEFIFGSEQIL